MTATSIKRKPQLPDATTAITTILNRVERPAPDGFEEASGNKVGQNPRQLEKIATELYMAFQDRRWPVYLWGMQGSGKSCLASCVYRSRPASWTCKWYSCEELIGWITTARSSKSKTVDIYLPQYPDESPVPRGEMTIKRMVQEAHFLVLDDICMREMNETRRTILNQLIDLRKGKPTIYTGNHPPEYVAEITDHRISSRSLSGLVMQMPSIDRRMETRRDVVIP